MIHNLKKRAIVVIQSTPKNHSILRGFIRLDQVTKIGKNS